MLRPRSLLILLAVGVALAHPATASVRHHPVSKHAGHFALLVGPEPGRLVPGFVDESKGTGTGFDTFALDLDGDGHLETRGALELQELDEDWILHEFGFSDGETHYRVQLSGLGPGRFRVVGVDWTVSRGDHAAVFLDGRTVISTNPVLAAFLPRIRLGGPCHFDVTTGQRGPDALVNVAFRDTMGCTLRLGFSGPKEKRIRLTLRKYGEAVVDAKAEYG